MADTITILEGLQHQKETTSDVYTLNGDGEAYEAVKSYSIPVSAPVSAAKVIFNGNYDPDGGRCHVRVNTIKITSIANGVPTKTENTQSLEWTTVTPPAMQRAPASGVIDLSACLGAIICIDVALSSVNASAGLEVIVQIRKKAGAEEWAMIARFIGPTGTGVKSDFGAQEAAAQTILSVTNPATGHLDHVGKFIFLEDTAVIAQCEIAWLVSQSGN